MLSCGGRDDPGTSLVALASRLGRGDGFFVVSSTADGKAGIQSLQRLDLACGAGGGDHNCFVIVFWLNRSGDLFSCLWRSARPPELSTANGVEAG